MKEMLTTGLIAERMMKDLKSQLAFRQSYPCEVRPKPSWFKKSLRFVKNWITRYKIVDSWAEIDRDW